MDVLLSDIDLNIAMHDEESRLAELAPTCGPRDLDAWSRVFCWRGMGTEADWSAAAVMPSLRSRSGASRMSGRRGDNGCVQSRAFAGVPATEAIQSSQAVAPLR